MYQVLRKDYSAVSWYANWKNIEVRETIDDIDPAFPVITGLDVLREEVRNWMNTQRPAIYIGRGYVGNHMYKTRQWWRYSVNGWANTKLLPVPYSRWNLTKLERHPWKVKEVKRVLIAPSKMTSPIWDPDHGFEWANYMAQQFPGAEVKIRPKARKSGLRWATLFDDLDWADLVVAQGSAITAEAFWYGKKVISLHPCITWAAGRTMLDDWQNPAEPENRDAWHEHLAWSQFSNQEWESGQALHLIEQYIGPIPAYSTNYSYNFR